MFLSTDTERRLRVLSMCYEIIARLIASVSTIYILLYETKLFKRKLKLLQVKPSYWHEVVELSLLVILI